MSAIRKSNRFFDLAVAVAFALPLVLQAACSSDGSSSPASSRSRLSNDAANVPVSGQFLAECPEGDPVATVQDFVENPDLETLLALIADQGSDVPVIAEVLAAGDPDAIPVEGGFVPAELDPGSYVPVSADDAKALLVEQGIPLDTPVAGLIPVTCDDVAAELGSLPDPTEAIAMIPVFDEVDGEEVVVAVLLTVVSDAQNGNPPDVSAIELPAEAEGLLPAELAGAVATLMSLLPL